MRFVGHRFLSPSPSAKLARMTVPGREAPVSFVPEAEGHIPGSPPSEYVDFNHDLDVGLRDTPGAEVRLRAKRTKAITRKKHDGED